jgi:hypothetical protein
MRLFRFGRRCRAFPRGREDAANLMDEAPRGPLLFALTVKADGRASHRISAYGPDNRPCGRPLRRLTLKQATRLLAVMSETNDVDTMLALPGLFAEACAASEDDSDVAGIFLARVATL